MNRHPRVRARPRRAAALLAALFGASLMLAVATPASAATTGSVAGQIAGWVNQARVARGLRALVVDPRLSGLASDRIRVLADLGRLDHSYPGDIGRQLDGRAIQWYRYGEVLAWSSATFGTDSAYAIYQAWRGSSSHWTLLMSDDFNYFGPGIRVRGADGATYASIVLTESVDHSAPSARIVAAGRYGSTLKWTWRGADRWLQTHTAGVRDYDVQYRVDGGAWITIRDDTSLTYQRIDGHGGHTYGLHVRATDRRGTVSAWSSEVRMSVP
jgi:uncharacterized protein YkwD